MIYEQQLSLHLVNLVTKFYSGISQEVMFGIPYSHCKVNFSKMTSAYNLVIIVEDTLPDAAF